MKTPSMQSLALVLLFSLINSGLLQCVGDSWEQIGGTEMLIDEIAVGPTGCVWAVSSDLELLQYDASANSWMKAEAPVPEVYNVAVDSECTVWIYALDPKDYFGFYIKGSDGWKRVRDFQKMSRFWIRKDGSVCFIGELEEDKNVIMNYNAGSNSWSLVEETYDWIEVDEEGNQWLKVTNRGKTISSLNAEGQWTNNEPLFYNSDGVEPIIWLRTGGMDSIWYQQNPGTIIRVLEDKNIIVELDPLSRLYLFSIDSSGLPWILTEAGEVYRRVGNCP